jgi:hypothetical protein
VEKYSLQGKDTPGKRAVKKTKEPPQSVMSSACYAGMWRRNPEAGRNSKFDGHSMKDASLRIGRNESFVHEFLKRGNPAELREPDREKLVQILGIPPDD